MAKLDLDLSEVEADTGSRALLPIGDYQVAINASVMKPTKAGTGHYLEIEMKVLEGSQAGATISDRFNLDNPNPKAVEIAKAQLKAVGLALGIVNIGDSSELHIGEVIAL